jgi:hypothetical protein
LELRTEFRRLVLFLERGGVSVCETELIADCHITQKLKSESDEELRFPGREALRSQSIDFIRELFSDDTRRNLFQHLLDKAIGFEYFDGSFVKDWLFLKEFGFRAQRGTKMRAFAEVEPHGTCC